MTITTLCIDLDGTIVSLEPRYVGPIIESIREILGDVSREDIRYALKDLLSILGQKGFLLIPRSLWKVGRTLGMSRWQTFRFLIVAKSNYEENRFNFEYMEQGEETLQYAIDNFRVVIITSAFEDELEAALEQLDLLHDVDSIIGFNDVVKPKPDPEGIISAMEKYDLKSDEIAFIGDLPSDVEAGKRADVTTIGFTGTYDEFIRPLLEEYEPDYLVTDHNELQELLKNLKSGK